MGGDGEDTDRYGRLLRYVDIAGADAGLTLIEEGFAIARYDSRDGYGRHDREDTYVAEDAASPNDVCPPSRSDRRDPAPRTDAATGERVLRELHSCEGGGCGADPSRRPRMANRVRPRP